MNDNVICEPVDYVNEAAALVRIWRRSVECTDDNPQIDYSANDLSNMLLAIEDKLDKARSML